MKYWHFFPETVDAVLDVTETFDFLWPTAAAVWNLRWQVRGFLDGVPDATEQALRARFVEGSGLHGCNVRKFCVAKSWDDQQAILAKVLLLDLFAIYESWCSRLVTRLTGDDESEHIKGLQFPTAQRRRKDGTLRVDGTGAPVYGGVRPSIVALTTPQSTFLSTNLVPALRGASKYAAGGLPQVDRMLVMYRYFKEARNCVAHNGSIASREAEAAYLAAGSLTRADLGVNEVPKMLPTVAGQPTGLALRGVVGMYDIVIRLITTLDAELAAANAAEPVLLARWSAKHPQRIMFAPRGQKRRDRVLSSFRNIRLPCPVNIDETVAFLSMHGLAH